MAVYRIGDVLRMKREALGITREKLCEMSGEICSPQTLYRMECGKVKVKRETYKELMRCMGQLPDRKYAPIKVKEYQYLNAEGEIVMHFYHGELKEAEKKLNQLERVMIPDYARNRQYLSKRRNTLAFRREEISTEEFADTVQKALLETIPALDRIDAADWPYNEMEFELMRDTARVYRREKQRKKEEELLLKLKQNVERRYIEDKYYVLRYVLVLCDLSSLMCIINQLERALDYCRLGLEESRRLRSLGPVDSLLYNIVWIIEHQIERGLAEKKEREQCKKLLVQAYYLNVAQKEDASTDRIKELIKQYYPEEIKIL